MKTYIVKAVSRDHTGHNIKPIFIVLAKDMKAAIDFVENDWRQVRVVSIKEKKEVPKVSCAVFYEIIG